MLYSLTGYKLSLWKSLPTQAGYVSCAFCLSVCLFTNFIEIWWQGVAGVKEETVKFWSNEDPSNESFGLTSLYSTMPFKIQKMVVKFNSDKTWPM